MIEREACGQMIYFNCDYNEGAHEKILERIVQTNWEQTEGYGGDRYCSQASLPPPAVHFDRCLRKGQASGSRRHYKAVFPTWHGAYPPDRNKQIRFRQKMFSRHSKFGKEKVVHCIAQKMAAMKEGNAAFCTNPGELALGVLDGGKEENLNVVKTFFDEIGFAYSCPADNA